MARPNTAALGLSQTSGGQTLARGSPQHLSPPPGLWRVTGGCPMSPSLRGGCICSRGGEGRRDAAAAQRGQREPEPPPSSPTVFRKMNGSSSSTIAFVFAACFFSSRMSKPRHQSTARSRERQERCSGGSFLEIACSEHPAPNAPSPSSHRLANF